MNTTLNELDISDNFIGKDGVMEIVKACVKNKVSKLVCNVYTQHLIKIWISTHN